MNYFEKLNATLINEGFRDFKKHKIPEQIYCKNYLEFKSIFLNILLRLNEKKIFILTDGQFKLAELNETINIDQKIQDIFLHDLEINYKNLAFECQVSPGQIHASEKYLNYVDECVSKVKDCCRVFIALGSGTITDLLKHSLYRTHSEALFISIPTAMTVTAFTSSFSVLDIDGAKRTRESKAVDYTFWLEPLLQAAPMSLSRAGYGDLLARFVAYGDWFLGYKLGVSESYNELGFRLMEPFSIALKELSLEFKNSHLCYAAVSLLSPALAMAGIAMSLSGETTPLSGYEHVISHGLDYLRISSQRELVLHGEQVALASLASAMTFDWLLEFAAFEHNKFRTLTEKEADKLIFQLLLKAPYNILAENLFKIDKEKIENVKNIFLKDYMKKSEKWSIAKENISFFINEFPDIKEHLKVLTIRASELEKLLSNANLPIFPEATEPSTSALEFRWALRFSPFVRTRFSVADFIFWIGEDPCIVAAI